MFSFAALVIHTCFRTSHTDWSINETSSYVDLSPLYGVDQKSQDTVRVRDGRGLLHKDSFAEDRLLLLPPAVCVLLVLFSRNHNVGPLSSTSENFQIITLILYQVYRGQAA